MIDRDMAWQKTQKHSKKQINWFIYQLNRRIKKQIKKGYHSASYYSPHKEFSSIKEREVIETYYNNLGYDYRWIDYDFLEVRWGNKNE